MVWTLVGGALTLTTLMGGSAPSKQQMAYARTAVAMRTCEATALRELKSDPSIAHSTLLVSNRTAACNLALTQVYGHGVCAASLVWPNGSPDGGNLLHSAGKYGCYDIMQELIVDFGLDPAEEAQPGAGLKGKTPYDLCVSAREKSQVEGQPDACDPDKWVELVEEAVEFKAQGGYVLHIRFCNCVLLSFC